MRLRLLSHAALGSRSRPLLPFNMALLTAGAWLPPGSLLEPSAPHTIHLFSPASSHITLMIQQPRIDHTISNGALDEVLPGDLRLLG